VNFIALLRVSPGNKYTTMACNNVIGHWWHKY
jgi:hypothetical protein